MILSTLDILAQAGIKHQKIIFRLKLISLSYSNKIIELSLVIQNDKYFERKKSQLNKYKSFK